MNLYALANIEPPEAQWEATVQAMVSALMPLVRSGVTITADEYGSMSEVEREAWQAATAIAEMERQAQRAKALGNDVIYHELMKMLDPEAAKGERIADRQRHDTRRFDEVPRTGVKLTELQHAVDEAEKEAVEMPDAKEVEGWLQQ